MSRMARGLGGLGLGLLLLSGAFVVEDELRAKQDWEIFQDTTCVEFPQCPGCPPGHESDSDYNYCFLYGQGERCQGSGPNDCALSLFPNTCGWLYICGLDMLFQPRTDCDDYTVCYETKEPGGT